MRKLMALLILVCQPVLAGTYDGTVVGSPTFGAVKFSNGLTATSDSNYVATASGATAFGSSASWTIEAWVSTTASDLRVFGSSADLSGHTSIWIGSQVTFIVAVDGFPFGSQDILDSGISINDGTLHHVAVVVTGGTSLKMFVDGVQGGSTHTGVYVTRTGSPFFIGRWNGTGIPWIGKIDELAVWDTAKYTTSFAPPSSAYAGSESGLRALFHLESNAVDSKASVSMALSPTSVLASSSGNTITVTGTLTSWLSGTVFSASGGTITAQSVNAGTQVATLTYTAPSSGPVTISEDADSLTASLTISTFTTVAPNDSHIIYSPFNWVVTSGSAKTSNTGAYLRTIFNGTQIKITTDTSNNTSPYTELWARVDGQGWTEFTLSAGNPTLTIATGLPNNKHLLEVVVKAISENITWWSSSAQVMVTITGFLVDPTTSFTSPIRKSKNILIYGDSITEGVKTISSVLTPDTDNNDILGAYAWALTGLDAEVGIVGWGGQGITQGGAGGVPALPSSYNFVYSGAARSFSSPAPDLVIYNQGTNDSGSITTGLVTVANAILAAAPSAKQMILVPFAGTHASEITTAVSTVGNALVTSQSTTGWYSGSDGTHPLSYSGAGLIAPKLLAAVMPILYPSGGGTTATVGTVY